MFWQKISKEVEMLGEEILSYYEEVSVSYHRDYDGGYVTYKFKGEEVLNSHKKKGLDPIGGFCSLNKKELKYLTRCFTTASLKKLTYASNKAD